MLTPDQFRARSAFLRFQHALDSLEQELKPLPKSIELQDTLSGLQAVCRHFYAQANRELFSAANPAVTLAGKVVRK